MSVGGASEARHAEEPALAWLQEVGWSFVPGSRISPGVPEAERAGWGDVVLAGRLRAGVARFNPELPADAVTRVCELVLTTSSPIAIEDHLDFHRLLVEGVPVSFEDAHGVERTIRARLVDFTDPAANDLLAVNQFTIIAGTKNRRPDVLLFVNGLPLAQLELKNPGDAAATPASAVNQIADYRDSIPGLYRFVEIVAVSDLIQAGAGTITTPAEHFAPWRSMNPTDDEGRSELEVMIRGMLAPERLLDLIENFCVFQTDGARTWKVLAKYHQVDAVNRAVGATREAMGASRRAGVVWHTQGSGKSLTMVFYVQKLRRDPAFRNPTVVALTDRNDLDQQLFETFAAQRGLAEAVEQAESIDGGPESLRALLRRPAGGIIFTTIQKFAPSVRDGEREGEMPLLSERDNVIVMADEAHRSQYGSRTADGSSFAENVTKALPNAIRIGFTGTPIERADRATRLVFGDYISVYSIARAVEDGATVPIYYESRRVPIEVDDPQLLEKVDEVLEGEEDTARGRLTTSWAKLERVVGNEARLERVAADIAAHYRTRSETLEGKALVIGMSRRICARLADRLKALLGDEAVTCVMSVSATDDPEVRGPGGEYRRSKEELKAVAAAFKDPADPLRLVVVRDMWLTGFDVPCLHTLYVDKPMRDHGLLQAIARVNRVFRDKPGGLVVDYIGIGDDLRRSLAAYDESTADEAMIPLETAIAKLREKHEVVAAMLHDIPYQERATLGTVEGARLFHEAWGRIVGDDDLTKRFLEEQALFARWFALVRPHEPALSMRPDAAFFADVAGAVKKTVVPADQASGAAEQAVKQFFSEGLAAGEVIDVFALAGVERPELSVLSDEFLESIADRVPNEGLGIALLRRLLDDQISVRRGRNQIQAALFSDRLQAVLGRYHARQISSAEVIRQLVELAKEIRAAQQRSERLGLSDEEVAFYDAIAGDPTEAMSADPELAEIARELVAEIRGDLEVDWTSREALQANIRRKIKRLLRKHRYQPPPTRSGSGATLTIDEVCARILAQARVLYAAWPDL
jgi:type I restriction enzyme R subunit